MSDEELLDLADLVLPVRVLLLVLDSLEELRHLFGKVAVSVRHVAVEETFFELVELDAIEAFLDVSEHVISGTNHELEVFFELLGLGDLCAGELRARI